MVGKPQLDTEVQSTNNNYPKKHQILIKRWEIRLNGSRVMYTNKPRNPDGLMITNTINKSTYRIKYKLDLLTALRSSLGLCLCDANSSEFLSSLCTPE